MTSMEPSCPRHHHGRHKCPTYLWPVPISLYSNSRHLDCGQYGRACDAGVFQNSVISDLLERNQLNIPKAYFKINTSDEQIPFMIVGDEAFPLKTYLMRPFAARTLNDDRRIYNYRHSRARRSVECAFGILAKKKLKFSNALCAFSRTKQL